MTTASAHHAASRAHLLALTGWKSARLDCFLQQHEVETMADHPGLGTGMLDY